jgi:hypothetical protein
VKKKCVNGFIMFCRMNRKQYIRWVGGLGALGRALLLLSAPPDHVASHCCETHLPLPGTHCPTQLQFSVCSRTHSDFRLEKKGH